MPLNWYAQSNNRDTQAIARDMKQRGAGYGLVPVNATVLENWASAAPINIKASILSYVSSSGEGQNNVPCALLQNWADIMGAGQ